MKKKNNQPVTEKQVKNIVKKAVEPLTSKIGKIEKRFDETDRRFDVIETRLEMHDRRFIAMNAKLDAHDKRFDTLEDNIAKLYRHFELFRKDVDDKFNQMFNRMDAFLKKSEDNGLEIKFLERQHDDLAKYCTEKIGYPTYGRNL